MNDAKLRQLWDRICRVISLGHPQIDVYGLIASDCEDASFNEFLRIVKFLSSRKTFYNTYYTSLKAKGVDLGSSFDKFTEKYELGPELNAAEEAIVTTLKLQGWVEEEISTPCPGDPSLGQPNSDRQKNYKRFPTTGAEIKVCLSKDKYPKKFPRKEIDDIFYCIHNYKHYSETAQLRKSVLSSQECERVFDERDKKTYIICYHEGGGVKLYGVGSDKVLRMGDWECLGQDGYVITWDDGKQTVFSLNRSGAAQTN